MDNFRKGNRNGGNRGGFGGRDRGHDRGGDRGGDRGPVTMHSAICATCGRTCEVPFRPTGDKPVYCRDCFAGRAAMGGERGRRDDRKDNNRRDERNNNFGMQNAMPKMNVDNNKINEEIKRQLEGINAKLERLIIAMTDKKTEVKTEAKAEIKAETKSTENVKVLKKVGKKK